MNRRQLSFVIILNALISLVIAVAVVWIVEARRPDPEALAALSTPSTAIDVPLAATLTPTPVTPGAASGAQAAGESATGEAATGEGQPAAASTAAAAASAEGSEYVVQNGDSLSGIADRFGIPVAAIMAANKLDNPDFVFVGQRLTIPSGDTNENTSGAVPTATPIASTVNTGIRVTAVGGAGDVAAEIVNIGNDSDLAVNLQGWRLEREGGPAYTFGNLLLFPGSGLKLHSGPGTDTSVDVYWNQPAGVWSTGAIVRLVNPQGAEVSRFPVP
jgi:LysM repeat protein